MEKTTRPFLPHSTLRLRSPFHRETVEMQIRVHNREGERSCDLSLDRAKERKRTEREKGHGAHASLLSSHTSLSLSLPPFLTLSLSLSSS